MDREEAAQVLGVNPEVSLDEAFEAYQGLVFPLRDYMLRNATIPKVFLAKNQKIVRLASALAAFGERQAGVLSGKIEALPLDSLPDFIYSYNQQKMALRTGLASTWEASQISILVEALVELEKAYAEGVSNFTLRKDIHKGEITALKQTDTGQLATLLKSKDNREEVEQILSAEFARLHKIGLA